MVVVVIHLYAYRKRQLREIAILDVTGREMKLELEGQLIAIIPHIYRRLSKMLSSVEYFPSGRWFWQKRPRILLTITLSSAEDLSRIQPMIAEFVSEYLARPHNRRYKVRILFLLPSTTHEGEVR
ncbi:MAG: hypothetical protein A2734_00200 [Parcubacteria group bacterium RIFCSPHIGHO2_01_FULL_40_30]|nr:MAG: hypothetical protein A2734_00200 [Parcubacteria group bacterium RIFCSPHIGHO2_01_FULL_40_30]